MRNYTLKCVIIGPEDLRIPKNVTYRWFKDFNGTREQVGSNTSVLLLPQPLKVSNAGRYTCNISIIRESKSSSVLASAEASWNVTVQSKLLINLVHSSL